MKALFFAFALAACGPNAAEIKTAKETTYQMKPEELMQIAIDIAKPQYGIADVDEVKHIFVAGPKFYGPEGDLESAGAGGFIQMRPHTVMVSFVVEVVEYGGDDVGVTVTPKTFQTIQGSPKPRELAPDDPNLPPFVLGRANQLAIDIYNEAKPHAYKR